MGPGEYYTLILEPCRVPLLFCLSFFTLIFICSAVRRSWAKRIPAAIRSLIKVLLGKLSYFLLLLVRPSMAVGLSSWRWKPSVTSYWVRELLCCKHITKKNTIFVAYRSEWPQQNIAIQAIALLLSTERYSQCEKLFQNQSQRRSTFVMS